MEIQEFKHYFLVNGIKFYWDFKLLPDEFAAITLFGNVYSNYTKNDLKTYLGSFYG